MQKYISFVITAAVLITAIATVALNTVNAAHAQSNMTSTGGAAKNMTGGPLKNMTGATVNKTGIHTTQPARCPFCVP